MTTPVQTVGTLTYFANPHLLAYLNIWYSYDPVGNTLTFCSNDLVSPDSTCLTTIPTGTNQSCNQHTYPNDNAPCGSNPNWNYCTSLTPGLQQALQQSVRAANQAIINAARAQGFTVIARTPPPQLTENDYAKLHGGGLFRERDRQHGDPRIAGLAWLTLWQNQFGPAMACTSLNFQGFGCSASLVGGHVILGQTAQTVPAGSNNVFIVPICGSHNGNNNVYMAPLTYQQGIAIHNYLH